MVFLVDKKKIFYFERLELVFMFLLLESYYYVLLWIYVYYIYYKIICKIL